jgi:hypothetical protein
VEALVAGLEKKSRQTVTWSEFEGSVHDPSVWRRWVHVGQTFDDLSEVTFATFVSAFAVFPEHLISPQLRSSS